MPIKTQLLQKSRKNESTLERKFRFMWESKYPDLILEPEYRFAAPRLFRADFYRNGVIIELEGGIYSNGRHTRGSGFADDCEKYNLAALKGLIVFRLTKEMITYEQIDLIAEFMHNRENTGDK